MQKRLRSRTEDDRGAALADQEVYGVVEEMNSADRDSLDLVKDDDGVGKLMQSPHPTGSGGEQGFQELHSGSVDDGGIPVFGKQLALAGVLLRGEVRVMLQYDLSAALLARQKHSTGNTGVLVY